MIKIKADHANAPQWRMLTVKATLPDELKCLGEIAHNGKKRRKEGKESQSSYPELKLSTVSWSTVNNC